MAETSRNVSESQTAQVSSPVMALIWFGASVSLAEILTGTYLAPLGFEQGMAAILLGHLIGGAAFFAVALLSARTGKTAMQAVSLSFGKLGQVTFGLMNVVQLVGWTAIMVLSGAAAAAILVPTLGLTAWCAIIGALIVVWIAIGMRGMSIAQGAAAIVLFAACAYVSVSLFASDTTAAAALASGATLAEAGDVISFGAAVELAAAMPLSWLPVVGDYTARARKALPASAGAALAYTVGSIWMFAVGLACAIFLGESDIALAMQTAGLGVLGIIVVVFSTVTTTFLDAASAGFSAQAVAPKLPPKIAGIIVAIVGTVAAIVLPVGNFEGFLYAIGSVFAPLAAVLIADALVLRTDVSHSKADLAAFALWIGGFVLYRFSMAWDIPTGNTLVVMVIIAAATCIVRGIQRAAVQKRTAHNGKDFV